MTVGDLKKKLESIPSWYQVKIEVELDPFTNSGSISAYKNIQIETKPNPEIILIKEA